MLNSSIVRSCTVRELHEHLRDSLGIPHFQRGMVWGEQEVSRLLESLLFATPCGSLIFWKPLKPETQGVSLLGAAKLEYLILDGQQRIHSLLAALDDEKSEDEEIKQDEEQSTDGATSSGGNNGAKWHLNLARLPGGRERFAASSRLLKSSLFVKRHADAELRHLIPLRELLRGHFGFEAFTRYVLGNYQDQKRLFAEFQPYLEEVVEIMNRSFPLIILEEKENRYHLSEVVQVYNRINSSGKKVEVEERAFATLVSLNESTQSKIAAIFAGVHPPKRGRSNEREDVMQRRKEKMFGFKLFIRLFVQASSYHFNYSLGSDAFSFSVVDGYAFNKYVSDPQNQEKVDRLWQTTMGTIFSVHRALTKILGCDDLRFFPGITSLLPVFQFLIRFPAVQEEQFDSVTAEMILRLMLADPNQRDLLNLVNKINRCNIAVEAVRALREKTPANESKLRQRLESSNSLQDRYVLLLYWLLRSAGARDFSYGINLSPEQAARIRDANRKLVSNPEETGGENSLLEVLIQAGVRPEKQHIVPYTQLKNLYSLTERSRLSNHEANNISNLTYISHHLNGLEGLSDKALNFRNESEVVLGAHFLDRDDPFHGSITKEKYLRFCKQRRERLARAFHKWLSRLVQGADAALPEQHRIEPVPRLFALTEEDRIRGCDFADMLEDSILSILMEPALRGKLLVNDEKRRRKDQRIIHLWFAPGKVGVQVYPNRDASDTIANIVAEKMATSPAAIYEGVSFAADAVSSQDQLRDVLTVLKETLATNPK